MPRLRRLSGKQVIRIFEGFGFEIYSQRGSHVRLQRVVSGQEQRILVAVHGSKPIPPGTLHSIYRQGCRFVAESTLKPISIQTEEETRRIAGVLFQFLRLLDLARYQIRIRIMNQCFRRGEAVLRPPGN